jgi:hypothetical protein
VYALKRRIDIRRSCDYVFLGIEAVEDGKLKEEFGLGEGR